MICGFPGETERDFQETVSLVQWAKLLHTHIFPYSPRAGTLAAGMKETVTDGEKKERCAFLLSVAKASSLSFAKARAGKEYRVLCEKVRDGVMYGYTENFLYTAVSGEESFRVGEIYPAVLEEKHRFSVGTLTVFAKSAKYG